MNRTVKRIHEWILQNRLGGVGYGIRAKASDGTWYMLVSKEPVITDVTLDATGI